MRELALSFLNGGAWGGENKWSGLAMATGGVAQLSTMMWEENILGLLIPVVELIFKKVANQMSIECGEEAQVRWVQGWVKIFWAAPFQHLALAFTVQ